MANSASDYLLLHCSVTLRCNYRCPYCYLNRHDESHDWFVDHSPEEWLNKILETFPNRRLQFELQGGEPLIYKPAREFLKLLVECDAVDYIRVNSNGSTVDKLAKELPSTKIRLMCTYHPSQVGIDEFLKRVEIAQKAGIVDMAKIVTVPEDFDRDKIQAMVDAFDERGIFLDVAYDWNRGDEYREDDWQYLLSLRTRHDAEFVMKCETLGQMCAAGRNYAEIRHNGDVYRCQEKGYLGNLFDGIQLLDRPAPCHSVYCCCIDRYSHMLSWRSGDRHLTQFVERNTEHRRGLPETNWARKTDERSFRRLINPSRSMRARLYPTEVGVRDFLFRVDNKISKIRKGLST